MEQSVKMGNSYEGFFYQKKDVSGQCILYTYLNQKTNKLEGTIEDGLQVAKNLPTDLLCEHSHFIAQTTPSVQYYKMF